MNEIVRIFLITLLILILLSVFTSFGRGVFHPTKKISPDIVPKYQNGIQYVGHGTILIQLDNHRILTDPILTDRIAGGLKRFVSLGIQPELYSTIEIVLISHKHGDHFHLPSLRQLSRSVTLIVGKGLKNQCIKAGFSNIIELIPNMSIKINNLLITAVDTEHPTVNNAMGYVIQGSKTIYFPGDTALSEQIMQKIGTKFTIDIALFPIGCYRGNIFGFIPMSFKNFHMGPEEVPAAIRHLQPKHVIPIHWGTFIIGSEPIHEAKMKLIELLEKEKLPVTILEHGKYNSLDLILS